MFIDPDGKQIVPVTDEAEEAIEVLLKNQFGDKAGEYLMLKMSLYNRFTDAQISPSEGPPSEGAGSVKSLMSSYKETLKSIKGKENKKAFAAMNYLITDRDNINVVDMKITDTPGYNNSIREADDNNKTKHRSISWFEGSRIELLSEQRYFWYWFKEDDYKKGEIKMRNGEPVYNERNVPTVWQGKSSKNGKNITYTYIQYDANQKISKDQKDNNLRKAVRGLGNFFRIIDTEKPKIKND
jgi:hypothetical protein